MPLASERETDLKHDTTESVYVSWFGCALYGLIFWRVQELRSDPANCTGVIGKCRVRLYHDIWDTEIRNARRAVGINQNVILRSRWEVCKFTARVDLHWWGPRVSRPCHGLPNTSTIGYSRQFHNQSSLTILEPLSNLSKLLKIRQVIVTCFANKTHKAKPTHHWEGVMHVAKVRVQSPIRHPRAN